MTVRGLTQVPVCTLLQPHPYVGGNDPSPVQAFSLAFAWGPALPAPQRGRGSGSESIRGAPVGLRVHDEGVAGIGSGVFLLKQASRQQMGIEFISHE